MALKGDITWTFAEESKTETEEIKAVYADGTEETIQQPKQIYRSESFTDVYLYVKSIQVHTLTPNNKKTEQVHYHFAGYESKEARDADNENFLFFSGGQLMDYDYDTNLWKQCYDSLKSREDFKNLIDC
jgi:hypothetical protein|tara:strand:+ start:61 stop:447 length:387 start_codon:yes stop_codon:yes gene_type:complete